MASRLELQKLPGRYHARLNPHYDKRGYDTNPRSVWGDAVKGTALPGAVYPAETTVTAQDGTNAAKLAALGYVASPTANWAAGQSIKVGAYLFNWSGSAWAAGAHA